MSEEKLLEKGDVVYKVYNNGTVQRFEVERVSPKFAFVKEDAIDRQSLRIRGDSVWNTFRFSRKKPELDARYERQKLSFETKNLADKILRNCDKITQDQYDSIVAILAEK